MFTYGFLVLTQSGMDYAHVEEDLGGIGDAVELLESFVELIVVVTAKGGNPCLDFLGRPLASQPKLRVTSVRTYLLQRHGECLCEECKSKRRDAFLEAVKARSRSATCSALSETRLSLVFLGQKVMHPVGSICDAVQCSAVCVQCSGGGWVGGEGFQLCLGGVPFF